MFHMIISITIIAASWLVTVYEHMRALYKAQRFFLIAIYMGSDGTVWTVEEALNNKKGYALDFERHCDQRENLSLKVVYGKSI